MESYSAPALSSKLALLDQESRTWTSKIRFTEDELIFIDQLLHSYVFEPNTPNLFERLSEYQHRLKQLVEIKGDLQQMIRVHTPNLGELLECKDQTCEDAIILAHTELGTKVDHYISVHENLKSEIFNYAGGILKKRKA